MRAFAFCLLMIGSGLLPAQRPQFNPPIRSIRFETISTSRKGLPPVSAASIEAALKRNSVNVDLGGRLDPAAVQKADQVIHDVYKAAGQAVRVEHRVNQIPPRSVEVSFRIIELCSCN